MQTSINLIICVIVQHCNFLLPLDFVLDILFYPIQKFLILFTLDLIWFSDFLWNNAVHKWNCEHMLTVTALIKCVIVLNNATISPNWIMHNQISVCCCFPSIPIIVLLDRFATRFLLRNGCFFIMQFLIFKWSISVKGSIHWSTDQCRNTR